MKRFPISRPLELALLGLVLAAAPTVGAPALGFDFLMAQLETFPSLDQKIQYLKAHPPGGDEAKIAVAVSLIQSAPPEARAETAFQVTQLLSSQSPRPADAALFAGSIAASLPERMAAEVAPALILGTGRADPAQLPKITVAVLTSRTAIERNAPWILQAVVAGAPVGRASAIAAAVGAAFADHPELARSVPEIAAAFTRGLLSKLPSQARYGQVRTQIAESVATLLALLPGSWQANRELITRTGQAVAREIGTGYPGLAAAIVGMTDSTLRTAAGTSDISPVLSGFRDAFGPLDAPSTPEAVAQANDEASNQAEPVAAGDDPLTSFSPFFVTPASALPARAFLTAGSVASPESNVVNP